MTEPAPKLPVIDRVVGALADRVLAAWDSPMARRARRRWRHRRRIARVWRWRLVRHPRWGGSWLVIERLLGPPVALIAAAGRACSGAGRAAWRYARVGTARFSESRAVSGMDRAEGAVRRFLRAHGSAWRWLGRSLARPFTRAAQRRQERLAAQSTLPAMESPRPSIFRCAVCRHESMGVGLAKYSSFACPRCGAPLLVIDHRRGRTTVGTAAGNDPDDGAEKAETEGMITPLTGSLEPVGSDEDPTPRHGTRR